MQAGSGTAGTRQPDTAHGRRAAAQHAACTASVHYPHSMPSPTFPGAPDPVLAQASPADLQALAASRPDLRPQIAAHPAAYDSLLQWLAQDPNPQVRSALAARAAGQLPWQTAQATDDAPTQAEPATQSEPPAAAHQPGAPSALAQPTQPLPESQPTQPLPATPQPPTPPVAPIQPSDVERALAEHIDHKRATRATSAKRRRIRAIAAVLACVLVLLAVVGAVVYTRAKPAPLPPASSSPAGTIPSKVSAVTIAMENDGEDPHRQVIPMSQGGPSALQADGMSVTRLTNGTQTVLAAVGTTQRLTKPAWQVTLTKEHASADCSIASHMVVCGTQAWNLKDGSTAKAPASHAPATTTGPTLATLKSAPVEGYQAAKPETAWARTITRTAKVGGVAMPGRESTTSVVLDGPILTALTDGTALWKKDLGERAEEVNGTASGTPHLEVTHSTVIVGASDGVVAVELATGKELWALPAPDITSWGVATSNDSSPAESAPAQSDPSLGTLPTSVIITEGDTLSQYDFPSASGAAKPSAPPAPPVDLDALKNATLELPANCALNAALSDPTVTLSDGSFTGGHELAPSMVTLTESQNATFGGDPVAVTLWTCNGGGNTTYGALGVYNSDLKLIGQFASTSGQGAQDLSVSTVVQGDLWDVIMTDLAVEDETVTFTAPGIALTGDSGAHATNGRSSSATLTLTWNGSGFDVSDVLYHTPSGDVRTPKVEDVQKIMDAITSDDIASVQGQMTPDAYALMTGPLDPLGPPGPYSEVFNGATVSECMLVGPTDASANSAIYFPSGTGLPSYAVSEAQAGDTVCALDSGGYRYEGQYILSVTLQGQPDGSVMATDFWHQFG